jgi:hypothetical protein
MLPAAKRMDTRVLKLEGLGTFILVDMGNADASLLCAALLCLLISVKVCLF